MESARKYHSQFGADSTITAAQYLTEYICQRIAKKEKKTLTVKFWNKPEWSKIFRAQITHANRLLKQYTCMEILTALKSFRGLSIYSLGYKKPIETLILASRQTQGIKANVVIDECENIFDIENVNVEELKPVEKKTNLWEKLK